jgi:kinesin family protein 6/9
MLHKIKRLRASYKESYDQLKALRSEIDYCSHLVDQCRQKFMTEFEQWYETIYGGQGADANHANGAIEVIMEYFIMIGCFGYW